MRQEPGIISADYKVAGGKLLRVRLRVNEDVIAAIRITGDFFMHPEEALETLEHMLLGTRCTVEALGAVVRKFFATGVEVVGADVEDFVTAIMKACK